MIKLIGWLWWWCVPVRKRLAIANFEAAFPDRSASILRQTVGEMVWGYIDLAVGKRATLHGTDHIRNGGICIAGHLGAWDLALISLAERIPCTIFVRTPANPLIARWIRRLRLRAGLQLLDPSDSLSDAHRALHQGRLVIFVQDQRHNSGVSVPFFGRPALTSCGFGALASRTKAPLFGAHQWRDSSGQHHVQIEPLILDISADHQQAVIDLTHATQRFYENRIKAKPHSWLWLHDRWRANSG